METNNLPIYDKEKCAFFALGRNAMYAACKLLKLKPGDEVLTPAFDCDGSLQPFTVLGLKLRFFRSDAHSFSADIDDIKIKVTSQTKLIHIINHFGMPQPWDKLLLLRKERGIPILEDNAYSLFSTFNGRAFGTFGDMAIFSLRKNLPLTDGGLLRVNNPLYVLEPIHKKPRWLYPVDLMSLIHGFLDRPPPPLYSDSKKDYAEWSLRDRIGKEFSCDYLRPMSRLALIKLRKFLQNNFLAIIEKKRCYYVLASEKLRDTKGITVLWPSLPEGIVPFCLSFLVKSKRDVFLEVLRKKYEVMAWPTFSSLVLNQMKDFPEIDILGRKLLQLNLPVDKIRMPNFPRYLENAIRDIQSLSQKYL